MATTIIAKPVNRWQKADFLPSGLTLPAMEWNVSLGRKNEVKGTLSAIIENGEHRYLIDAMTLDYEDVAEGYLFHDTSWFAIEGGKLVFPAAQPATQESRRETIRRQR